MHAKCLLLVDHLNTMHAQCLLLVDHLNTIGNCNQVKHVKSGHVGTKKLHSIL